MDEYLKIEKDEHILRVTLNRPERRNALSTPICEGLLALPAQIEADIDIRCVVITGAGEGFCSGADLKERKELDEEDRWQYVEYSRASPSRNSLPQSASRDAPQRQFSRLLGVPATGL